MPHKNTHTNQHPPLNRLGRLFRRWGEFCYDRPWVIIGVYAIFVFALLSQILHIQVDMSAEAMLRKSDPVRIDYNEFKKIFGREDAIILSIPTQGVLNNELLESIVKIHRDIESTVPHVDKVTSLLNARRTYGDNDELRVDELLENYPTLPMDNQALLTFLTNQPAYVNRLISEDGQYTAIAIQLNAFATSDKTTVLSENQNAETVDGVRAIIDQYPELDIAMAGEPAILTALNRISARDAMISASSATVMILVFLAFFFRRRSGVLLPLLVINGAMIGPLGLMGFFDAPFTMSTTAIFALVIGMGVADSVHILSVFYRHYETHGNKRESIVYAMGHSAPAVVLTTLTTAIGFLSFVSGDLASTADLGLYSAASVSFALLFSISLLPSLISLFKIQQEHSSHQTNKILDRFLMGCAFLATTYPRLISISGIAALLISLWGSSYLYFSFDLISDLPEHMQERIDHFKINDAYKGSAPIEILIDSRKNGGIYDDQFIARLKQAAEALENKEIIGMPMGASYSLLTILKETHKALHNNKDDYYVVPQGRKLVSQETFLFEMKNSEDLFDVIDSKYRTVRLSIKTEHNDGVMYEKLMVEIENILNGIFRNEADITITGANALLAESIPRAMRTMAKSYTIAASLIILVMMIMVQSVRIGLVSIIPNILPIALVMGIMPLMGWSLNMSTIMVGAIAMGIVVDDTLHFVYHFKINYNYYQDAAKAVEVTLQKVGPALFITTVIFGSCMATTIFSSIDGASVFGKTLVLIAIFALLADILIAPALMVWVFGKKKNPAS